MSNFYVQRFCSIVTLSILCEILYSLHVQYNNVLLKNVCHSKACSTMFKIAIIITRTTTGVTKPQHTAGQVHVPL